MAVKKTNAYGYMSNHSCGLSLWPFETKNICIKAAESGNRVYINAGVVVVVASMNIYTYFEG